MTFGQALRASVWQGLVFAALFAALTFVGDLYWDRPILWVEKIVTVGIGFAVFWLLTAYKKKVKNP